MAVPERDLGISEMEHFMTIINGSRLLTIAIKSFILELSGAVDLRLQYTRIVGFLRCPRFPQISENRLNTSLPLQWLKN